MTTDLVLLGLCAGFGLLAMAAGLRQGRPSLADEMTRDGQQAELVERSRASSLAYVGASVERLVVPKDWLAQQARDLAMTLRSVERHFAVVSVSALLGILVPIGIAGSLTAMGWRLPSWGVLAFAGAGGAAGVAAPTIELRRAAQREREHFRLGLSCWLELVALAQAGGMGVEGAIDAAGRISSDPGFSRIRQALARSRHSGTTPWEELGRLGFEIGVDELAELAASLGLAGSEGARIRASLRAKSESLRRRQMSEAESRANSTTERLFLPSIVLMIGFLIFLMYPAGVSLAHVI